MNNANAPAAPFQEVKRMKGGMVLEFDNHDGLTKREMFAMHAMQGILANSGGVIQSNSNYGTGWCNTNAQGLAEWSIECADALLAELDKEKK